MNERIRGLLNEATSGLEPDLSEQRTVTLNEMEKFAELIVRECCNKIESEYKYALGEKTQWAMSQDVQDLLKEHFGVEE